MGDLGITLLGLNMGIMDLLWSREIGIVSGSRLKSASNVHFSEDKKTDDTHFYSPFTTEVSRILVSSFRPGCLAHGHHNVPENSS